MGADNRRIDKELAGQRTALRLDAFPELAPEPAPFPAAKAVRDCVPASKRLWQVAPWRPRAQEEDGFNDIRSLSTGYHARFNRGKDGAISAQAASVSNKRTDIRFPLACIE